MWSAAFRKACAPLSYLDVNPAQIAAGAKVFETLHCTSCHTKEMKTGTGAELAEARNQTIRPYTDLLLHDMGPDLADNFSEGQATGSMWRTSALWGIGYTEKVAGNGIKVGYLHDSRARTLTEAILWHGGEGHYESAAVSGAERSGSCGAAELPGLAVTGVIDGSGREPCSVTAAGDAT